MPSLTGATVTHYKKPAAQDTISLRIAGWARGDHRIELGPDVAQQARLCIADFLSSALTSDIAERSGMAWHAVTGGSRNSGGACSIIGTSHTANPDAAAFVNATSASSTSRSDTFAESATHPGQTVIPAILAIAEQRDLPLEQMVSAVVVGYEVMAQLGSVMVVPETSAHFRPSGLVGAVSAAAGASHALGLDAERTAHAIGIAAQAISGFNQWAREGSTDHVHHIAYASSNGVRAALLAEAGAIAPTEIYEGTSGILRAFRLAGRGDAIPAKLGAGFGIMQTLFKPAPVCMYAQVPVQAAAVLAAKGAVTSDAVASVEIRTCRVGADYPGCDNADPIMDYQAAKQSIQFSVACVLAAGEVRDENWLDYRNASTNALSAKCRVVADPAMTAVFPKTLPASIDITMADGTHRQVTLGDMIPFGRDALVGRLRRVAEPRIGAANISRVLDMLFDAGGQQKARSLAALLRRDWQFSPFGADR